MALTSCTRLNTKSSRANRVPPRPQPHFAQAPSAPSRNLLENIATGPPLKRLRHPCTRLNTKSSRANRVPPRPQPHFAQAPAAPSRNLLENIATGPPLKRLRHPALD